jgi:hypothetical protein
MRVLLKSGMTLAVTLSQGKQAESTAHTGIFILKERERDR